MGRIIARGDQSRADAGKILDDVEHRDGLPSLKLGAAALVVLDERLPAEQAGGDLLLRHAAHQPVRLHGAARIQRDPAGVHADGTRPRQITPFGGDARP